MNNYNNLYSSSNPLEEFNINIYNYLLFINYNFSISTLFIHILIINFFFIILLLPLKNFLIPSKFQYLKEYFFNFLTLFLKEKNINFLRNIKFIILYINLFFFILWSNLTALCHYGQSVTAQLLITIFFSLSGFLALNIIGILLYKLYFYKIIEPEDVPKILFIAIFIIEFFSFLIRPFSLGIRLFANMLAGHMLLVLITIFILFIINFWIFFAPFFFSSILLFLIILEIIICFIQTYVFVILFLTYMEQLYNLWMK